MKPAITAFSAMLLWAGAASAQSQYPAGTPSTTGTTKPQAEPSRDPRGPSTRPVDTRPVDTNNLRDQLLQGAINTILKPRRPRPPPVEPAPPVVLEPTAPATPAAAEVEPVRPVRPVAAPKVVPAVQPAPPPKAIEPPPTPRPAVEPTTPEPAPAPLPVEPAPIVAPPVVAATVAAPPPAPVEPAPTPILAPQPAAPVGLWLLLALVAAAIAAATAYARRARQISRTRAALSLNPSLDLMAGSCSASGLAFAGPPISVHARLDDGGTRNG